MGGASCLFLETLPNESCMARVLDCFGACEVVLVPGNAFASAEIHPWIQIPGRRAGEGAGRDIGVAAGLDDQHTSILEEAINSIFASHVC